MSALRPFGLARIALGAVFVVRTTALVNLLPIPLAHVRGLLYGWPEGGFAIAWGGLVLPDAARMTACIVRTMASLLFLFGVRARAAGVVAGLCGLLALSQDPFGFLFTLYTLFLGTIALALSEGTDLHALVPDVTANRASGRRLVHLFIATVYVWSAIAKLQSEWLSAGTLLALAEDGLLSPAVAPLLLHHPWARLVGAWLTLAIELGLPVTLLVPRTRTAAVVVGIAFHVTLEIAARPDVMGLVLASLLLSFLPDLTRESAPGSP